MAFPHWGIRVGSASAVDAQPHVCLVDAMQGVVEPQNAKDFAKRFRTRWKSASEQIHAVIRRSVPIPAGYPSFKDKSAKLANETTIPLSVFSCLLVAGSGQTGLKSQCWL